MTTEVKLNPCARCGGTVVIKEKWGTTKWVIFLLGLLGTFWCVGIVLILIALCMKNDKFTECTTCGLR